MPVSTLKSFIDLSGHPAPLETYVSGKPHPMSGLPSDFNISALPFGGQDPHEFFRWRLWSTLAAEKNDFAIYSSFFHEAQTETK